ncbi:MAG: methyltransferase domain-containing protein, partial [Acetobacterales bacterium]
LFRSDQFSAAILRSYLEHELNPKDVLLALHRVLAVGGLAFVKVPNFASLNRLVMGRRWTGFRHPDHLNYFTPATLRLMARRCGFQVNMPWSWRLPTSDNMYAILLKAH